MPGSTDFTVKIIPNLAQWSYNNDKIANGKVTINYGTSTNAENTFRLSYDGGSGASLAVTSTRRPKNYGDYGEMLPDGIIKKEDGSYAMVNDPAWNFTSEDEEKTFTLSSNEPLEGLPLNVLGYAPDLTVTVKAHKPELEITENTVAHLRGDYDEVYRITIPKGMFEPGSDSEHFARILLVPQFDTFDSEAAATEFYGTAPRHNVTDSWLSPKWYKENGHKGFLPIMQYDEYREEYFCEIDPTDMIYEGWDGRYSYGNKLVSGHYKVYLIPSENPDHRQYGIIASEPADLYIHPTLHDMKLHLCIRDAAGQESYWKDYDIENDFFTFSGPKANAHGETAYRHARLTPNCDYCEIWVESARFRPAYPEGEIPGYTPVQKNAAQATLRAATDNSLDGYTKVGPDDYVDLGQPADEFDDGSEDKFTSASIKLVKNGAVSPAQEFYISKSGDSIITGIDAVSAEHMYECGASEYFTPAGIRVATPETPGIYIERRGSKTHKVAVH